MQRPTPGPKTRRLAMTRLRRALSDHMDEERIEIELADAIPDAWAMLESDVDCSEKKTKVTLYLDASVAKFFRAMGKGYQERINRLLGLYAQAKIAEVKWFEEAWEREYRALLEDRRAESAPRPAPPAGDEAG
jgi:uncharacterized protein (DUF4415 family)